MKQDIKNYLKKFEQLLPLEVQIKKAVMQSIDEIVHHALLKGQIAVSGTKVFITGPSALKSEIALKQGKILARVAELLPGIKIEGIY